MKILCIGDLHFKDNLGYAEYIPDGRVGEKKEILDFIVKESKDCDAVVLMGDNFNSKNNTSETNREFVEFIERFGKKDIYILSGNHEKKGDGKTAIDFLREVKKSNWVIITSPISIIGIGKKIDFLPYMLKSELGVETNEEAVKVMMKNLTGGDVLFMHHAIGGFMANGIKTDTFGEPVFSRLALERKYQLVVAGHVHDPQMQNKTIITGNVFTDKVGETEKFIWKVNPEDGLFEKIKLPGRPIIKLENPKDEDFAKTPQNSIVKVVVTDKKLDIEEIKMNLSEFDASLLIEDYPNSRKKAHIEEGAFDFSIEALLKLYSEEKGVDYQRLLNGLQLINN